MTTKLVCETAALADAVAKAARVAPNKGAAFDKAQGVLFQVRPGKPSPLYVKATNLDLSYLQRVPVVSADGDEINWRLPAPLLAGVVGALPLGAGQSVTIRDTDAGDDIIVESGTTVATLRGIDPQGFPEIKAFDPNGMAQVEDLAQRLDQVAWATDDDREALTGIRLDGEHVYATNGYVAIRVACKVPVAEPVTIPIARLTASLKNSGAMGVRAKDGRVELMPDQDTQITCRIIQHPFPDISKMMDDVSVAWDQTFKANPTELAEIINRMLVITRSERYPKLRIKTDDKTMHLSMEAPGIGHIADQLYLTAADDIEFLCQPGFIVEACTASTRSEVTFHFGNPEKPFGVKDAGGLDVVIVPLVGDVAQA